MLTRREFATGVAATAFAASLPIHAAAEKPAITPAAFSLLPLGEILPAGWLRDQLRIQADGMSGRLHEHWPDVGPNSGWLGGTGEHWERGPYFLDGLLPLAYLLDDAKLKAQAQKFIDWTLDHPSADGTLGPAKNRDWWPNMVMLKALAQYYEVTGDKRVLPAMSHYFAYQLREMPAQPLKTWAKSRWQDEVYTILWLYDRAPEPHLLALAHLLKQQGRDWRAQFEPFKDTEPFTRAEMKAAGGGGADKPQSVHGVNQGMALKTSPVWYRVTGDAGDRAAFAKQLAALDRYHGQPNGMFSCDEHLAGREPVHGTELCTVVETLFSLEIAMSILGEAWIGDRIEKIAYNALPGTFTDEMTAHQYDQQANQVQCSLNSKPWTTNGPESNLYGKEPNFGCCTANFHQGWPKLTTSLWMKSDAGTENEGLVAAIYAPCEVRTEVRGVKVHLVVETEYPFRDTFNIQVHPEKPLRFPIRFRVPLWAEEGFLWELSHARRGALEEGGVMDFIHNPNGHFGRVDRVWETSDAIRFRFPMQPRIVRGVHNSVSVERGPLVFSFDPGTSWMKMRDYGWTADWQVFPQQAWNYALAHDEARADKIEVMEAPLSKQPFAAHGASVLLHAKARRLDTWRSEDGVAQILPQSPVDTQQPEETITLVPYGAAKLRITAFPQCSPDHV
ncbi:MAG: glycoside hydrolase family 127 protein [Acidobacteria bacterium]|nr:glycoside hydrolase family 127 protein [Acidobacteriota bacterium]